MKPFIRPGQEHFVCSGQNCPGDLQFGRKYWIVCFGKRNGVRVVVKAWNRLSECTDELESTLWKLSVGGYYHHIWLNTNSTENKDGAGTTSKNRIGLYHFALNPTRKDLTLPLKRLIDKNIPSRVPVTIPVILPFIWPIRTATVLNLPVTEILTPGNFRLKYYMGPDEKT